MPGSCNSLMMSSDVTMSLDVTMLFSSEWYLN